MSALDGMRVAILFEFPTLLGGERSLLAMLDTLVAGGHRLGLIGIAPPDGALPDALRQRGWPVVSDVLYDARGVKRPVDQAVDRLRVWLVENRVDRLHANSLAMGRISGRLGEELSAPTSCHLRDIIKVSRRVIGDLNGNRQVFAVSEATRQFHVDQGLDPRRVSVLYNGIDVDAWRRVLSKTEARRRLGIDDQAFVTLTVGQIGLRKGWDVYADALRRLAGRYENLHALFVGKRYSTKPETVALEARVREMLRQSLGVRAHWLGERDDVPQLFAAADVLVHPARQEPFGRILLEGAAAGCPILATEVGGTREMLGEMARLIPPDSPSELETELIDLIDDVSARERMAQAARERIMRRFDLQSAAGGLGRAWGVTGC